MNSRGQGALSREERAHEQLDLCCIKRDGNSRATWILLHETISTQSSSISLSPLSVACVNLHVLKRYVYSLRTLIATLFPTQYQVLGSRCHTKITRTPQATPGTSQKDPTLRQGSDCSGKSTRPIRVIHPSAIARSPQHVVPLNVAIYLPAHAASDATLEGCQLSILPDCGSGSIAHHREAGNVMALAPH